LLQVNIHQPEALVHSASIFNGFSQLSTLCVLNRKPPAMRVDHNLVIPNTLFLVRINLLSIPPKINVSSFVGLNEKTIQKYIQKQEKRDIALDKLSVRKYEDPFKGS